MLQYQIESLNPTNCKLYHQLKDNGFILLS